MFLTALSLSPLLPVGLTVLPGVCDVCIGLWICALLSPSTHPPPICEDSQLLYLTFQTTQGPEIESQ